MMKTYEKYKDSGVEWIGEVPEHWEKHRFKDFLQLNTNPSFNENKIGLENIEGKTGRFIETSSEFEGNGIEFIENDIVYGKLRPYLKKVWLAEFAGNAVGDFFIFRNKKNSDAHFLKYLFLSDGFTKEADGSTFGAKMPRVSSDFIRSMTYYLPLLSEQQCIASYLDKKCADIDKVIATQQRRIELLQELKQSTITHAVTRGLNPNVKMKDSGVEWIGEVPEHWKVMKSSLMSSLIGSGTTPNTNNKDYYCENEEEGYNWLQTGDLNNGLIISTLKKVTLKAVKECNLKFYTTGSIVIAMYGATIGKVGILGFNTAVNQACCVLSKTDKIVSKFVFYLFLSAKESLLISAIGGGQPNISQDVIKKLKVVVPPLSEQQAIATYLDKKCAELDNSISKAQKEIDLLQEYKQALVTEVVTGKRKVC